MAVDRGLLATLKAETEEARQAHLNGQIPAALEDVAPDLLATEAEITPIDVLASK